MLVYFVNHSTAPVNLGGAERSLIRLVEEWYAADPDFEAFFITKAPRGRFIDAIEQRGWGYQAFRYRGWAGPSVNPPVSEITYFARDDYAATTDIIRTMEARRPDLVVTNTIVAPWGAFAAAVLGIPHAWFVREYGDLDHGLNFQIGRRETFEDIDMLSAAVFTNSQTLKSHIGQYLDESKVSVVYPQVNVTSLQERAALPPAVTPFPADAGLKLTVVGRLSESKGQWRAVEALGVLATRGVRAHLCLVGSWEIPGYDLQLLSRARGLGVADHVTIVGEQSNPFPYIAAADVCITPSSLEAFGRSTLEYMLVGRAVVASSGGGSSELVAPNETGFLFPVDDTDALATAIERYAWDPELAVTHGRAGQARANELMGEEFSNAAAIDRLKQTAKMVPYRLPNIARHWFALPDHYFSMGAASPRITLGIVRSRIGGRVRNFVQGQISVARRVGRAWRAHR